MNLSGLMFESDQFAPNPVDAQRLAITVGVIMILVMSITYYALVIVIDILVVLKPSALDAKVFKLFRKKDPNTVGKFEDKKKKPAGKRSWGKDDKDTPGDRRPSNFQVGAQVWRCSVAVASAVAVGVGMGEGREGRVCLWEEVLFLAPKGRRSPPPADNLTRACPLPCLWPRCKTPWRWQQRRRRKRRLRLPQRPRKLALALAPARLAGTWQWPWAPPRPSRRAC